MNNRQAPETSPHPPQPTNHWLSSSPNVFTVHTLLCCGQGAHAARRCVRKYGERDSVGVVHSRGSTYYDVQELCWHILLPLSFAETWKCELNYRCRRQIFVLSFLLYQAPSGSCASIPKQLCYWGSVVFDPVTALQTEQWSLVNK